MVSKYNKIVLVASAQLTNDRPPAALAFLAGVCEFNNVDYEIFDLNIYALNVLGKNTWVETYAATQNIVFDDTSKYAEIVDQVVESAAEVILTHSPDLIAITSFSAMQIVWTKKILEKIRQKSQATIIAGGPGISYEQEPNKSAGRILAEQNLLDYYVLGEGDHVFNNFLKGKLDIGVNSKNHPWENWVPQIDNLDEIIVPTYKKIKFDNYDPPVKGSPIITVLGSRGCIRRCTFCEVGHIWKKFRFKKASTITAELIKHYNETGITEYSFTDSLINGSLKQFTELMLQLIELKNQGLDLNKFKFTGQFIVREAKHHPESMFALMKESGFTNISTGIETGSDRVRLHMGKKFFNSDIDYHMEMCEKYNIKNTFLIFTGYPTETIEDHMDTINMIKKYQKYVINDTILLISISHPLAIYKNTPLDSMREELGIHSQDDYENLTWVAETNPTLTPIERYRRHAELVRLTVELRYPRMAEDVLYLEHHFNTILKLTEGKK